jgi:subtilase family serine protease
MIGLPLASAAFGAAAPVDAYGDFAARGGHVEIPASGIELPEHIGVKAHTNFDFFIPNAGKASEQFSHEVPPEQTGGPPFAGYFYETPASLACVYQLVSPTPAGCNPNDPNLVGVTPKGGSRAIAIVDAYHYPTAVQDLAYFSKQFKLPQANFTVVYANGRQPPVNANWNVEEALDIEWAHAMAPNATIYLVEARSANYSDLLAAVSKATSLVQAAGGGQVSMSWGGSEFSFETLYDAYFRQPGVVYFAAAGDSPGVTWPSASPYVVSVGGTSISRDPTTGAFQQEVTWQSGGGGPSVYEGLPAYQTGIPLLSTQRGTPDVAADANPSTGVWVYVSPYWYIVGGTSVATPVWAGIVNSAGHFYPSATEFTSLYSNQGTKDITAGSCGPNQGYLAGSGWDFCTGLGSPLGTGGK